MVDKGVLFFIELTIQLFFYACRNCRHILCSGFYKGWRMLSDIRWPDIPYWPKNGYHSIVGRIGDKDWQHNRYRRAGTQSMSSCPIKMMKYKPLIKGWIYRITAKSSLATLELSGICVWTLRFFENNIPLLYPSRSSGLTLLDNPVKDRAVTIGNIWNFLF